MYEAQSPKGKDGMTGAGPGFEGIGTRTVDFDQIYPILWASAGFMPGRTPWA